jgi:hypothetical protein
MESDDIQGGNSLAEHTLPRYKEEGTLPISRVMSMESDDIQVETLSLSTDCPGIQRRICYLLARCRVWRADIQVDTFLLSTHCPNLERRMHYLLARLREIISR